MNQILLLVSVLINAIPAFIICSSSTLYLKDLYDRFAALFVLSAANLIITICILGFSNLLKFELIIALQSAFAVLLGSVFRIIQSARDNSKSLPKQLILFYSDTQQSFKHLYKTVFKNRTQASIASLIILILFAYLVLALGTNPMNFDSNTYRLTRIAYWLQNENLFSFTTNDHRHNYSGMNFDLFVLWLMSPFDSGYHLTKLVSYVSGIVVCFSIGELARILGFNMTNRLIAVLMFLGFANASSQFISTQTDLIATAFFIVSLVFLIKSEMRNIPQLLLISALSLGIGIGGKGTILYAGPALLLFVGLVYICYKNPIRTRIPYAIIGTALLITFASPTYLKNYSTYNHFLAPKSEIGIVGKPEAAPTFEFAAQNATGYVWQIFEPGSNPNFLRPITNAVFTPLMEFLLDQDPIPGTVNHDHIRNVQHRFYSNNLTIEDSTSTGLLPFVFIAISTIYMIYSPNIKKDHKFIFLSMGVFLIVSFIFFSTQQKFTEFKWRYFVLGTPFIAIMATWFIQGIKANKKYSYILLIVFISASQGTCAYNVFNNTINGFVSFIDFKKSRHAGMFFHYVRALEKVPNYAEGVGVALDPYVFLTAFFRNESKRTPVKFIEFGELKDQNIKELFHKHRIDSLITSDKHFNLIPELENHYKIDRVSELIIISRKQ